MEEVTFGKRPTSSSGSDRIIGCLGFALRQAQELLGFRPCLLPRHLHTPVAEEKAVYLLIKRFTSLGNGAWIVKGSN